jgi:hypothetical protein
VRVSANRWLKAYLPRPRWGPESAARAEDKMPVKGTSLTRQPLAETVMRAGQVHLIQFLCLDCYERRSE